MSRASLWREGRSSQLLQSCLPREEYSAVTGEQDPQNADLNTHGDDSNTLHASENDMAASKVPACRTLSAELRHNLHGDCQRVFVELPRCLLLLQVKIFEKVCALPDFSKGGP